MVVPLSKREDILKLNHDHKQAGHLGFTKTLHKIKRQYEWPGLNDDVLNYVRNCITCAKRKLHDTRVAPLCPLQPVSQVWERIAMDIVGPVQETERYNKYILVVSDYASRFVITVPMADQKARTVAYHFVNDIILKYGSPTHVLTDQEPNFLSQLIKDICTLFGIKQMKTTAYHPQTDGLVERLIEP